MGNFICRLVFLFRSINFSLSFFLSSSLNCDWLTVIYFISPSPLYIRLVVHISLTNASNKELTLHSHQRMNQIQLPINIPAIQLEMMPINIMSLHFQMLANSSNKEVSFFLTMLIASCLLVLCKWKKNQFAFDIQATTNIKHQRTKVITIIIEQTIVRWKTTTILQLFEWFNTI